MSSTRNYRYDIQGLRFFSVFIVILNHLKISHFDFGYVGVDIFFVISGFVISKNLSDNFNPNLKDYLINFYSNRLKRLIPALFATIFLSTILFTPILLPDHLEEFLKEALYSTFQISNYYFYKSANYFDLSSEFKPLLHTWSLGVEEQFYLIYPLIFFSITATFQKWKTILLTSVSIISICSTFVYIDINQSAVFYNPLFRIWEFFIGSIAYFSWLRNKKRNIPLEILSILIIAYCILNRNINQFDIIVIFLFNLVTSYFLINEKGLFNQLLKCKLFVFLGNRSYSIYLIHLPIIIYFNYHYEDLTIKFKFLLIVLILLISIPFHFIFEKYIRELPKGIVFKSIIFFVFTYLAFIFYCFAYINEFYSNDILSLSKLKNEIHDHRYCHNKKSENIPESLCVLGDTTKVPQYIIWGDSHADMYTPALVDVAKRNGFSFYVATKPGCIPTTDNLTTNDVEYDCWVYSKKILEFIDSSKNLKNVIISGYWDRKLGLIDEQENYCCESNMEAIETELSNNFRIIFEKLEQKKIFFILGAPHFKEDFLNKRMKNIHLGNEIRVSNRSTHKDKFEFNQKQLTKIIGVTNKNDCYDINYINVLNYLCDDKLNSCFYFDKDQPLYRDEEHLTPLGSSKVIPVFEKLFK